MSFPGAQNPQINRQREQKGAIQKVARADAGHPVGFQNKQRDLKRDGSNQANNTIKRQHTNSPFFLLYQTVFFSMEKERLKYKLV